MILRTKKRFSSEAAEKITERWYRDQLKAVIPAILERWETRIGVKAKEWRIKKMKTRWGTCNVRDRRIWISLQLAPKPLECLEYVIVHELIHLLERNHNAAFWSYMDQFYPDWREIRNKLE